MISTSQVFRNMNAQAIEAQKQAYSATETQQTGETGRAMGYAVKAMADPGQSLIDSMEELAMGFEEKKINDLAKRELGELRGKSSLLSAAIDKWMKMLPGLPDPARFERLLQRVRSLAAHGGSAAELLELLENETDDATEQHAMLDILESADGLDADARALVRAAKESLHRTRGEEVRAGLNLAQVVSSLSTDAAELRQLRRLYRDEVLGYRTPQDCFRSLLSQRGAEGLRLSIAFLVEACGVDLQSATPSKSKTELARILGDLQCVSTLTAMLDRTNRLVTSLSEQFGVASRLDGTALAERLVALTETAFVDKGAFAALVRETGLVELLAQLYFMTTLQGIVRQLSPRLFGSEETRQRLVDAAQEHLDDLVAAQQQVDEREGRGGTR